MDKLLIKRKVGGNLACVRKCTLSCVGVPDALVETIKKDILDVGEGKGQVQEFR